MDEETTVQEPEDGRVRAIEFANVTGGYRRATVFSDMSFTIREGSMAALIGPNGSGKTSMLRATTGLLPRVSGQVRLFGQDVRGLPAETRAAMIGVVPQETFTPMAYTVEEIVMMGRTHALSRWNGPGDEDHKRVEQAMIYTDVADMRARPFPELSGGERQRVIIAMVLAQQPRVILMDEATSQLDINHRLEVMQLIERLNREQGVTVLMVSHDLNMAAEFCERLLLIDGGQLVADGAPADVLTESLLREVYHCDVKVQRNAESGSVMVVPTPRLVAGSSARGVRLHAIAGGGCGEEILRRLTLCEYTVSCGVLNEGDSDAGVAEALELDVALERPFSPVGGEAFVDAERLAGAAQGIVICGVPFGPGNVVNLELAERMLKRGIPVFMMEGIADRDYTPDGKATAISQRLCDAGAREWKSIADLLQMLPGGGGSKAEMGKQKAEIENDGRPETGSSS
jgi:iron complex transport system ATP-binding protein